MTPQRGFDKVVLYLDYDGVLHCEDVWWTPRRGPYIRGMGDYKLFQHTQVLVDALAPYPDIRIVLSTSWVRHYGYGKAASRLPAEIRRKVIGATFHSEMNEASFVAKSRGQQILGDVQRRRPRAWLALDDDDDLWPAEWRTHLVRSHPELGISEVKVLAELKEKLAVLHK